MSDIASPDFPPSLWNAVTRPRNPNSSLSGEARAGVAIIGAGFTGLSAALHLAERGHKVIVLEAVQVGWGASGRNNGQVIPTMTGAEPDSIAKTMGRPGSGSPSWSAIALPIFSTSS